MNFRLAIFFAWILSLAGMLGSLYFSDIRMLEPCHLCWYQRITLYPLALWLLMACWRNDGKCLSYVIPFPFLGTLIAIYEVIIQANPAYEVISACGAGASCTEKVDIGLGPITLPMLSLAAQLLTTLLLIYAYIRWKQSQTS